MIESHCLDTSCELAIRVAGKRRRIWAVKSSLVAMTSPVVDDGEFSSSWFGTLSTLLAMIEVLRRTKPRGN